MRWARRAAQATTLLLACGDARQRDPWDATTVAVTTIAGESGGAEHGEPVDDASSGDSSSTGAAEGSSGAAVPEGDYPNIARIARPPAITDAGGGVWMLSEAALPQLGQAFYAAHPDDYDFLVVYTEGDIVDIYAFAWAVQYETRGIGLDGYGPGTSPAEVGSAGRLLQIDVMNTPAIYDDPDDASIAIHEFTHHWSAFIELPGTPTAGFLLDDAWAHFNIHVSTGGPSATGYGELVDLGGGQFQYAQHYPLRLSPLELYLAGLVPPAEVPPMFYVKDAHAYDPPAPPFDGPWRPSSYSQDARFSGTRVDFGIADVIAANGAREPAFGSAPTDFRAAFVMVCDDVAACPAEMLAVVEAQRVAFEAQLPAATGDRASVDTTL